MSEYRGSSKEQLFHEDHETYRINDIYEHGMDILRMTGDTENTKIMGGDYIASRWGDDKTRYRCFIFAKNLEEGSTLYIHSYERVSADYQKSFTGTINTPVGKDGEPRSPYIEIDNGDGSTSIYYGNNSDEVKAQISYMLAESGIEGPILTDAGRDRFWESAASLALDGDRSKSVMQAYAREVAEGRTEHRDIDLESDIAGIALSQTVSLDSGQSMNAYDTIPRRYVMRQIEAQLDQSGNEIERRPQEG